MIEAPPPLLLVERPAFVRPAGDLWVPAAPAIIRARDISEAMLPGLAPAAAAAGPSGLTIGEDGSQISTASATTYNFASCAIGAAASDRFVVVAAGSNTGSTANGRSLISGTVNGVACTLITAIFGADYLGAGLLYAAVPSGTSVTISVTWNANTPSGTAIAWAVIRGKPSISVVDDDNVAFTSDGTRSFSLNTTAGGCLFVANLGGVGQAASVSATGLTLANTYQSASGVGHRSGSAATPATATPTIQGTVCWLLSAVSFV